MGEFSHRCNAGWLGLREFDSQPLKARQINANCEWVVTGDAGMNTNGSSEYPLWVQHLSASLVPRQIVAGFGCVALAAMCVVLSAWAYKDGVAIALVFAALAAIFVLLCLTVRMSVGMHIPSLSLPPRIDDDEDGSAIVSINANASRMRCMYGIAVLIAGAMTAASVIVFTDAVADYGFTLILSYCWVISIPLGAVAIFVLFQIPNSALVVSKSGVRFVATHWATPRRRYSSTASWTTM